MYGSYPRFGVANASTDPCGIETIVGTDASRPIDHTVIFGDDVAKQYWQPHPMQARVAMLTDIGLAGVLAVVSFNMVERPAIAALLRSSRGDAAVLAITFLLVFGG